MSIIYSFLRKQQKNRIIHASTSWCHAFSNPTEKKYVHSKCSILHAVKWRWFFFIHLIASTFKHWRKGDTLTAWRALLVIIVMLAILFREEVKLSSVYKHKNKKYIQSNQSVHMFSFSLFLRQVIVKCLHGSLFHPPTAAQKQCTDGQSDYIMEIQPVKENICHKPGTFRDGE